MRELQLAFISNRTTGRLLRILSVIEREREFTLSKMAEKLEVTQRTVANDVKQIKEYFGESIVLVSGNSGFAFQEKNAFLYKERKQKLLKNECLFKVVNNIFHGKLKRIDQLAHDYHFSESTFRRILAQCTPILKSYGLKWQLNPINIVGDETNLRKFFTDFYYEGVDTEYTLVPDKALHELVLDKLNGKLGKYEIGSGTTPAAFYYTFYIAIKRACLGYAISIPTDLEKIAYKGNNFSMLYSLKEGIKRIYGVELSKVEFAWVYLVTLCKRTLDREDQEQKFLQLFNQGNKVMHLTDEYLGLLDVPIKNKKTLRTFLCSFFLSRKLNHLISPVLNKEMNDVKESIIQNDPSNYKRNLLFLQKKKKILSLSEEYIEDISVGLTMYGSLLLDRYSASKTIYFLIEGDHFICQYIQTRAIQQFGCKHSVTFIPLQYLNKETLKSAHIDLIVTNYDRYLLDYIIDFDYLLLKSIPDEQDWQHLERIINPYRSKLF